MGEELPPLPIGEMEPDLSFSRERMAMGNIYEMSGLKEELMVIDDTKLFTQLNNQSKVTINTDVPLMEQLKLKASFFNSPRQCF